MDTKTQVLQDFMQVLHQEDQQLQISWDLGKPVTPQHVLNLIEALARAEAEVKRAATISIHKSLEPLLTFDQPNLATYQYACEGTVLGIPIKAPFDLEVSLQWNAMQGRFTDISVYQGTGGGADAVVRLLKEFGHSVHMITFVGRDRFGNAYVNSVNARGHAADFVRTESCTKVNLRVLIGQQTADLPGATVGVSQQEFTLLKRSVSDALTRHPEIRYMVTGGGLKKGLRASDYANLVQIATQRNVNVVMDFSSSLGKDHESISEILNAKPQILKVNRQEFKQILLGAGQLSDIEFDGQRAQTGKEFEKFIVRKAKEILVRYQVPMILITLDVDGALAVTAEQAWIAHLQREIEPLSAITAGDSFIAGFLHNYIRGQSIDEALSLAVAAGTATTKQPGSRVATVRDIFAELPNVAVRWAGGD